MVSEKLLKTYPGSADGPTLASLSRNMSPRSPSHLQQKPQTKHALNCRVFRVEAEGLGPPKTLNPKALIP